jgi:hypothetical protein
MKCEKSSLNIKETFINAKMKVKKKAKQKPIYSEMKKMQQG